MKKKIVILIAVLMAIFILPVASAESIETISVMLRYDGVGLFADNANNSEEHIEVVDIPISDMELYKSNPLIGYIEEDSAVKISALSEDWYVDYDNVREIYTDLNILGDNAKIAVLDTGISFCNGGRLVGGINIIDESSNYGDDNGHGTSMANIITTMAPNSQIYSVKVLDSKGEGYYSDIIEGIEWSIDNDIDVICMSFGSFNYSYFLEEAINKAYNANIAMIAAAGNDASEKMHYPAAYNQVIAVGACDEYGNILNFTNAKEKIDLYAPGINIITENHHSIKLPNKGTSVSTAQVAAVVGLMKSAKPDYRVENLYSVLNHSAIISESGAKILDGYNAFSNMNAFINNSNEYIPTLDKTYIDNEDNKVAISYKLNGYDNQTVSVNDSVTVRAGFYSDHDYCYISVYKTTNQSNILAEKYVYDVVGSTVETNYITYICPENVLSSVGTYKIRYHASGNGTDTTYDDVFTVYVESIDDDNYEYNDDYDAAYELTEREESVYATISSASDEDYYAIWMDVGETIDISLENLDRDYELYFYKPSQSRADYSNNSGTDSEYITYTATTSGYHYIRVYGYDGACCSTEYLLSYSVSIPADDYEEHKNGVGVTIYDNDIYTNSTVLSVTNNLTIYPMISHTSDEDWFSFVAPNGDVVVTLEDLPDDYELELYGAGETLLKSSYKGGTSAETVKYTVSEDYKTLYIKVYGYSGACSAETYTLNIFYNYIDDVGVVSDKYTANVTWTTGFGGPSLVNYGKTTSITSKKEDSSWTKNHNISLSSLSSATKYYYKASTISSARTESEMDCFYTKDRYEDNDAPETAYSITSAGQGFSGTIHSPDDEDWYKVTLSVPGIIYLSLEDIPSSSDYDLYLTDSDSNLISSSAYGAGSNEYIECFVEPGRYYIAIDSFDGSYVGDSPYLFTYDFDAIYYNDVFITDELHMGGDGTYSPTGNYSKTFADLEFTNTAYDYYVGRTYNSRDKIDTHFGRGWMFSFEGKVSDLERTFEYSNGNIGTYTDENYKMVKLPDSSTYIFEKQSNGTFVAQDSRATLVNNGSGYTFTTQDRNVYVFNSSGYLTSMTDKYGNGMSITVNSSGKVQNFTDPTGNTYTVSYGSNGYISTVTENVTGRAVTYNYTNGLLTSVTNPSGVTSYYEYDSDKYMSVIKDNDSITMESLTYISVGDEPKKINAVTDAYGNVKTYTYNESENKTVITDSNGRTDTQSYDDTKFITSVVDAMGRIKTIQYVIEDGKNKYGEIASVTDEIGNVTSYIRDSRGNVTKQTNPDGSYQEFLYDDKNNVLWERDSLGNFTLYEYDSEGIKLVKKARYLDKVEANQTVTLTNENSDLFAIEEYSYYPNSTASIKGLLHQYKNALGYVTEYTYDAHGNPLTVKDPETGALTSYTYNEINYTLSKTTPKGYITQYIYDNAGNLVKETNTDDGGVIRTIYDDSGRKVLEINPQQYNAANDTLNVANNSNSYSDFAAGLSYEYYPNGLLKKKVTAEGDVTEYTYDLYGNILTETIPAQFDEVGNKKNTNGQFIYGYDNLNRLTSVSYKETADSTAILLKTISYSTEQSGSEYLLVQTETTYLDNQNSTSVVSKLKYNDKEVYIGYSDGSNESFAYYDDGELKTSTDGNGNTTYYKYNSFDEPQNVLYHEIWTPADGGYAYARTDYDISGNKVAEYKSADIVELYAIPQNLYKRTFVYYKNGSLKQEFDSEGRKTEYEYDNDGNISKMSVYTDSANKYITQYVNNSRGQVVTETKSISADTLYNDARTSLVTTYSYDLNGNLLSKTTPDGVTVTSTYDKQNRAITTSQPIADENGETQTAVIEEKYNSNDDVYYRKDARGGETYFIYDNRGLCVKEISPFNGITLNYYDYAGRLTNVVKPNAYSENGTLQTMNNTEYMYNAKGLVTKKIEHYTPQDGAEQSSVTVSEATYDFNGNLLTEKDAMGNTTVYTYAPNNKIKTMTDAETAESDLPYTAFYVYNGFGQAIFETTGNGIITSFTYDALDNVLTKSVSSGDTVSLVATNVYDKASNLLSETDGNSNTTTYTYNSLGEIATISYPYDESIPANIVTRKYAPNGKVAYEVNSIGTETLYEYDQAGRTLSVSLKNSSTSPITTQMRYDLSGNIAKEIDANGNTTVYVFDLLNRKISETKNGKTTEYSYDANDNLLLTTDWRGNEVSYEYDPLDRLIKTYDAYDKLISEKTYNANGLQISDKDAMGSITHYQYDKNNRLIATTDALNHTTSKGYDVIGNVILETDPKGNTKTYSYDKLNNLISVTQVVDGVNSTTAYTYDNCGNILIQTDAKGNMTAFEYNCANLVNKKVFPGGAEDITKQETYTYYADGTMATKTDRNGVTHSYSYDIANRPTQTVSGSTSVSTSYDAAGNKTNIIDGTGNTIRTYDSEGRVLTKQQPNIGTFTYTYDIITDVADGEYAEISVNPANKTNKKIFDKAGRLHYVYDGNSLAATYTYYDNGALEKVVYGNGASEEYTYFADGSLQTLVNKNSSGTITDQYSYTYDANGNQTSKTELIASENKGTTTYEYDELNQLVKVTEPTGKITEYSYDSVGNRTNEVITDGDIVISTVYTYDEQNRLLKTVATHSDAVITYEYQYDYNGNLFSKTKSTQGPSNSLGKIVGITIAGETEDGVSQYVEFYEYDEFNQLIRLTKGASVNVYAYNGEGLRVSKIVGDQTTLYGYEYDIPVIESDGTNITTVNLYGTNLISRTIGNDTLYYQYNGHADVVGLTDGTGALVASYYYDAFGVPTEETGDVSNPFRYGGYMYDEETGLYYIKSRFYDATIARFLQEDVYTGKYNDPLSLNKYTYVLNNPLKYLDPTGMIPDEIKVNGKKITHLKGYATGIYGSFRDLVNAYGKDVSFRNGIYYANINGYTFELDTKGIGKIKGDKSVTKNMTVKYKGRNITSDYFVAVKDVNNSNAIKLLVNVDYFVSKVGKSHDECVKYYNKLDTFKKDISDLGGLAIKYNGNNKVTRQLTFQQLRSSKYSGGNWTTTAGEIDAGFTKYIKDSKRGDLNFEGKVLLKDVKTGNYVDVNHMAATINAYLYSSRGNNIFNIKVQGTGDGMIDNLSGWAGDLQSLIGSLQSGTNNSDDYDKLYHYAYSLIGNEDYAFGMQDMYADIDAVNIAKELKENPDKRIVDIFGDYYTKSVKRYKLFAQEISGTTKDKKIVKELKEEARDYTKPTYMWQEWPIYTTYKKYPVTDNQGKALADAFTHFIDVNIER